MLEGEGAEVGVLEDVGAGGGVGVMGEEVEIKFLVPPSTNLVPSGSVSSLKLLFQGWLQTQYYSDMLLAGFW